MTAFTYDKQKNPKSNKTLEKWREQLIALPAADRARWLAEKISHGRYCMDNPRPGFDVFDLAGIIFTLETWFDQAEAASKQEAA